MAKNNQRKIISLPQAQEKTPQAQENTSQSIFDQCKEFFTELEQFLGQIEHVSLEVKESCAVMAASLHGMGERMQEIDEEFITNALDSEIVALFLLFQSEAESIRDILQKTQSGCADWMSNHPQFRPVGQEMYDSMIALMMSLEDIEKALVGNSIELREKALDDLGGSISQLELEEIYEYRSMIIRVLSQPLPNAVQDELLDHQESICNREVIINIVNTLPSEELVKEVLLQIVSDTGTYKSLRVEALHELEKYWPTYEIAKKLEGLLQDRANANIVDEIGEALLDMNHMLEQLLDQAVEDEMGDENEESPVN